MDKLALLLSKNKRFQSFEAKGTILQLLDIIETELLDGNSVCLDNFGTFSLTLEAKRQVEDADEIRAESIRVKRVTFKPSPELRRKFINSVFIRSNE